ncbi:MAG: hypothetical protein WC048_08390 [Rhizobium sp.]
MADKANKKVAPTGSDGALKTEQSIEIKIAHLGMIQGVIARMAGDGQTMKTLAITISAAIVAVAPAGGSAAVVLVITGIVALLFFWWQTAYHLHVERSYRCLYDQVRDGAQVPAFTMDWRDYRHDIANPLKLAFTPSVLVPFLGMLVVLVVLIVITMSAADTTQSNGAHTDGSVIEQRPR